MANNLVNKFINAEDLSSILSHLVTKVNDKINTKPKIEIADTGEFVINDKNTGVKAKGENGNTTIRLDIDSSNNVIATMNDNTTINIGNLNPTVSPDMVSENGFGNLRYYNGKFQYKNNNTWIDIVSTSDNKIYSLLVPKAMGKVSVKQDLTSGKPSLILIPPSDTIVDGQIICFVEKVIIRRKKDSIPTDINDGEDVLVLTREHFKDYQNERYIDTSFNGNDDEIWYYRAFPVSTLGLVNMNMDDNYMRIVVGGYIYGFHIDQNESDPDSMITYIEDNVDFTPARMDYSTGKFNYGSWDQAWFIKDLKPCMLRYDGTVAYELDKNDYSKKVDGSDSDISIEFFNGNAMVGIPKVYYKVIDNGDNTANVYISDKKVDEDYHCYAHIDENGNEIDYCYMAAYNGYVKGGKLRSLSGKTSTGNLSLSSSISLAQSNNINNNIWQVETYSDRVLIAILSMLITSSTNSQSVFGLGACDKEGSSYYDSGTLDKNGLFYGTNTYAPVKIFGMENYWGNYRRSIVGFIMINYVPYIKMTYGTSDDSTVEGYNTTGNGYIKCNIKLSSRGCISKLSYGNYGFVPQTFKGSTQTYYCDYVDLGSGTIVGAVSGYYGDGDLCGLFYNNLAHDASWSVSYLNATLSCKPLATTTTTS